MSESPELVTHASLRFWARDMDRLAIREVIDADVYTLRSRGLPVKATVVDIGAHIGSFSLSVKSRFPHARVISYEPNPGNFALLLRNADENHLAIEAHNEAVWSDDDGVTLVQDGAVTASLDDGETPSVTLEDVLQDVDRCNLMKLDCEGAEVPAVLAAPPEVMSRIDEVVGEFHGMHPDWGAWVRYMSAFFEFTVRAHDYPNHPYGGIFWGRRK